MKRTTRVTLTFLLAVSVLAAGFAGDYGQTRSKEIRRYFISYKMKTPARGRKLMGWLMKNNFDVAGMDWRKGRIEVLTTDEGIRFLKSKGLRGRILPMTENDGPDPRYLNPEKVETKLKRIAQEHPTITRLEKIGDSHEGRSIWALLISSTPKENDPKALAKPSIVIDGMHHAREIMTSEVVMDVADMLISGVEQRVETAEKLIDRWNIWVVPMLNPDGNHRVWTGKPLWRKNARADGGSAAHGVDLNRNYPYRWGDCNGSSGWKSSQVYRGPSAASEPEAQAMIRLAEKVDPAANLSYHSYSELVLYPMACHGSKSSEHKLLARIGAEMARRLPSDANPGKTYTPGLGWELLYGVDGDSVDYFHAFKGALSYTFEINLEFQPPYSMRLPTIKKQRKAWLWFLKYTSSNMLRVKVVDGETNKPSEAKIFFEEIDHHQGERPFATNPAGYFFKILGPGNYRVKAVLKDGREAKVTVKMEENKRKSITIVVD